MGVSEVKTKLHVYANKEPQNIHIWALHRQKLHDLYKSSTAVGDLRFSK
jgi:hypothetical protein